jgi:hypothetical protein
MISGGQWHDGCNLPVTKESVVRLEKEHMLANILMMVLAYGVFVVPVAWVLRPIRLVHPY